MAVQSSKISTITMLFLVLCVVTLTASAACKPKLKDEEVTLPYKMAKSEVVAYGFPRIRKTDPRHPGKGLFYVEFEVRCIFKGSPLNQRIRIEQVGLNDTQCKQIKLMKDKPLMVYLNRQGTILVPSFKEDPGTSGFLDEVPAICGTTVNFPKGITNDNAKEQCPEEYIYEDDCVPLPTDSPAKDTDDSEENGSGTHRKSATGGSDGDHAESTDNDASYDSVKSGDLKQNGEEGETNPGGGADKSTVASLASVFICVLSLLVLV